MRKNRQPAFLHRFRNPFLLIFQRGHRIQIVTHDPRQVQMRLSRHQVREKERGLSAAAQFHALHIFGVPRPPNQFPPRRNRAIGFQQRQFVGGLNRHVVIRKITRRIALVRTPRMLEFAALHHVTRIGVRRHHFVADYARVPAAMVEMQMRIDDDIDFRHVQSVLAQAVVQKRPVQSVNIPQLRRHFSARAGFDQNIFPAGPDQQAIQRQLDTIPRVGWRFLLPQNFRHHSEHGAAVQIHFPIYQNVKLQVPKLQRFAPSPAFAKISFTAPYGSILRAATSSATRFNSFSPNCSPTTRSISRASSSCKIHSFQCPTSRAWRSCAFSKCFRNCSISAANRSIPLLSFAIVRTTGGFHPSRSGTSCRIPFNCCSKRSAPSRSHLFSTKISPISISPAFRLCTSSPIPGISTTMVQSARRTISISPCPTPTVSIRMTSFPAASRSNVVSRVACDKPPRNPRVAIDRIKTPLSEACPCIRMRSPRIDPPVNGLDGSTAIIPTAFFAARSCAARRSTKVLLPVPGAPVIPTRYALPVCGNNERRISSASGSRFSMAETAREIARISPARTCSVQFSTAVVISGFVATSRTESIEENAKENEERNENRNERIRGPRLFTRSRSAVGRHPEERGEEELSSITPSPRPLLLPQNLTRNHHPLNLAGPFANRAQFHVAIKLLRRIILDEPIPAVNLHCLVGHAYGHFSRVQFRHARFLGDSCIRIARRNPAILQPRSLIGQQARRFNLGGHVRQLELNRLKFGDGFAKLFALFGVAHRAFIRTLRHSQAQ